MAVSTVVVILVAGLLLLLGGLLAASSGQGSRAACSCGERNPTVAKYCRRCGRELPR